MTPLIQSLIQALRAESEQSGRLLACLDAQQEQVTDRQAEGVLQSAMDLEAQSALLRDARVARETCQVQLAAACGLAQRAPLTELAGCVPPDLRATLLALARKNRDLLVQTQQRARQNHLLLSRSLEFMRRFMRVLFPGQTGSVLYNGAGSLAQATRFPQALCDVSG
jgi:hypothetical protein